MTVDRSFVELNRAETARIRKLAEGLSDDELKRPVGQHWNVGVALAHIAFWDRRVLLVLDWAERDGKVSAPDMDVVVNDISLPLWHAIPPREAAKLAVATAEELDKRLEALSPEMLEQVDAVNHRWVFRSLHRGDHLNEVEQVLKG